MNQDIDSKKQQDLEAEVWGAIQAFEQILEAIPNDRASLEALWNAYEQIGDYAKSKEYLIRLGSVLVDEGDADAARELIEKLASLAEEDPAARQLLDKVMKLSDGGLASLTPEANKPAAPPPPSGVATAGPMTRSAPVEGVRTQFSMADELAFAWGLLEANQLTQEEYSSVVQDLTEMSAVESATTVSVLHVLESRAFKNLEKIMVYVSKECGTPIVSLANFDFKPEEVALLPMEFMMGRGAFAFEVLGRDALVALMNPYDKQLRKDVETILNRRCHYYMTLPSEFDKAINNIATVLSGKAAESTAAGKK